MVSAAAKDALWLASDLARLRAARGNATSQGQRAACDAALAKTEAAFVAVLDTLSPRALLDLVERLTALAPPLPNGSALGPLRDYLQARKARLEARSVRAAALNSPTGS